MEKKRGFANGSPIEYGDVIFHNNRIVLSFWDRIRLLFGSQVILESKIYTGAEVSIIETETKVNVPKRFKSASLRSITAKNAINHGYVEC